MSVPRPAEPGVPRTADAIAAALAPGRRDAFLDELRVLTAVAEAHERGTVPPGASPTDQWGDVYDLDVPGHPVLVEWFTGDPEAVTVTRITWLRTPGGEGTAGGPDPDRGR
ncbi:hypothetical protein [Streptomyces sp. NPDC058955]|uniref:hypothetical protein n=1 Tax=unclassified Streptomyces TaxID=2593676 RepID=UPI003648443A